MPEPIFLILFLPAPPPSGGGATKISVGVFYKIGSNFVVKIRNNLTFWKFPDFFVGGHLGRPRFRREKRKKFYRCAGGGI
ncbi:MAG: hypothetical protein AAB509_02220 [Patescibacteria group bacterium]